MTDNSTAALWRRRLDCTRQGLAGPACQGVKLQASWCAPLPRHLFRVPSRSMYLTRPRCAAGGAAGHGAGAAVWVQCFLECSFLVARTLRRETTLVHTFSQHL
jgi:hypothetical protein